MWVEQVKNCPQWLCLDKEWPHESHLEKPGLSRAFKAANDSLPNDIMDQREALKLKAFSSQDLAFVFTFPQCEVGLSGFVISFATRTDGKSLSKWWNSANRWWPTFKLCETLHFFSQLSMQSNYTASSSFTGFWCWRSPELNTRQHKQDRSTIRFCFSSWKKRHLA